MKRLWDANNNTKNGTRDKENNLPEPESEDNSKKNRKPQARLDYLNVWAAELPSARETAKNSIRQKQATLGRTLPEEK